MSAQGMGGSRSCPWVSMPRGISSFFPMSGCKSSSMPSAKRRGSTWKRPSLSRQDGALGLLGPAHRTQQDVDGPGGRDRARDFQPAAPGLCARRLRLMRGTYASPSPRMRMTRTFWWGLWRRGYGSGVNGTPDRPYQPHRPKSLDWQIPAGQWRVMVFRRSTRAAKLHHREFYPASMGGRSLQPAAVRNYCNYLGGVLYQAFWGRVRQDRGQHVLRQL